MSQIEKKKVLLDICEHENIHIKIARLAKLIRIYPDMGFKSNDIWIPIAQKLIPDVLSENLGNSENSENSINVYNKVAEFYSTLFKAINAQNHMIFITRSNRLYIVEYPQLFAMRIDTIILDIGKYPSREVFDITASKSTIAFAVRNPSGIIINDMGLLRRDQIERQVCMNGIMWTELVMFRNIKVKKIIAYWSNLMILLENGSLITLFANRKEITSQWSMNTMILKLPQTLGSHNIIKNIHETDKVYNIVRNECIDVHEDVEEVYPPLFKCEITDGEVYINIQPNDHNPTLPNTTLHVLDNIENE